MKNYRVNNIFYSLQGEGHNTGRAAVFVRFAGCNLRCPFCDTEFDSYREMTFEEIIAEVSSLHPSCVPLVASEQSSSAPFTLHPLVVLTGGEPTLQVDEAFVDQLHQHGYEVAMESNGTRPAPRNLDWLTVSPKQNFGDMKLWGYEGMRVPDEIKIVFDEDTPAKLSSLHPSCVPLVASEQSSSAPFTLHPSPFLRPLGSKRAELERTLHQKLYLQPCDTGDEQRNAAIVKACVEYIKEHPEWRLSLQTHKLIGIE